MQTTMLEATPPRHTDSNAENMLEAPTTDNTGYCDILSTLTAMQTTMLEAPINGDSNTGYNTATTTAH